MARTCRHCGGERIEEDAARGDTVCTDCGAVLEQNAIVSEVQFAETGGGGAALIGQYVATDGTHRLGIAGLKTGSRDSREQTIRNARAKIGQIANQLRLNNSMQEMALSLFTQALYRQLTKGRRTHHVAAACLYIACRSENHHLLLLDFSDAVQVNVYALGRVVHTFCLRLYINLPATDPCTYVMRFAHKLQFGDREHEVAGVALRLVQRMKRDWIATGRRPTGVCGAALLLASRYHQFNRTIADIVRVVHVGDSVVRRRLDEFANTASAALTLDEFAEIDLEQEADPPSFNAHRHTDIVDTLSRDLPQLEHDVEAALKEKSAKRFAKSPYAKLSQSPKASAHKTPVNEVISQYSGLDGAAGEFFAEELLASAESLQSTAAGANNSKAGGLPAAPATPAADAYGPTMASLGIDAAGRRAAERAATREDDCDGTLDLADIDDDEIDSYILSESETKVKERMWMAVNGTFMQEQEEKRRLRQEQEQNEGPAPKKRRRKKREPIQAATALEAMHKVIQEKKLSSKINWEALRSCEQQADPSPAASVGKKEEAKAEACAAITAEPVSAKKEEPGEKRAKLQQQELDEHQQQKQRKGGHQEQQQREEEQPQQQQAKRVADGAVTKVSEQKSATPAAAGSKPKADWSAAAGRRRPAIKAKVNLGAAARR